MIARRALLSAAAALLVAAAAPAVAQAAPKVFDLSLAGGRVPAERNTVRVTKGDKVELRWSSDRPMALHLHGYDLEAKPVPGAPAIMAFTANLPGRFPVSEHRHDGGHAKAVLYLEVHP